MSGDDRAGRGADHALALAKVDSALRGDACQHTVQPCLAEHTTDTEDERVGLQPPAAFLRSQTF